MELLPNFVVIVVVVMVVAVVVVEVVPYRCAVPLIFPPLLLILPSRLNPNRDLIMRSTADSERSVERIKRKFILENFPLDCLSTMKMKEFLNTFFISVS